jgi:hypothetical protein
MAEGRSLIVTVPLPAPPAREPAPKPKLLLARVHTVFAHVYSLKMLPGNILALLAREAVSLRILGLGVPYCIRVPGVSAAGASGGRDVTRERKRVVMLAVWGASTLSEKEAVCVQRANERRHYTRSTHTTRR